jgi:hypothetical protein
VALTGIVSFRPLTSVTQNPIDKKRFMETDCEGFAIYIHPQYLFHGVKASSEKGMIPYRMMQNWEHPFFRKCALNKKDNRSSNGSGGVQLWIW